MDAQNQTPQQAPVQPPFFFKLNVFEGWQASLEYQANAPMIFGTIIAACRTINGNFDNPLPSVGDFLRYLAEAADEMDAQNASNANDTQENGQPASA